MNPSLSTWENHITGEVGYYLYPVRGSHIKNNIMIDVHMDYMQMHGHPLIAIKIPL